MAATAYASLASLLNTLDAIHTHPLVSTFFDMNQNKSLSEKVNFLVDFVETYSNADSREVEDLVRRIGDAAHEAEDMIEVYAADRVRGRRESRSILPDLQIIIENMESIEEEVIKVKEEAGKSSSFLHDLLPSPAPPATDEATTMVGFDDYKHKLMDDLLGHDVDRRIISITGMGGLGKTTLARNLYENPLVVRHFNVRAWITVSQEPSARKVYLQALSCLGGGSIDMDTADDLQLSDELYKTLYKRRFLIVLDDVWSVGIWDKIKFFFPENGNGSRIIITTRESKLLDYNDSSSVPLEFLDKRDSWKLFCEKTFPQQGFPPELKEVGKKIVKKCGGLPLAIAVIGGLLAKSPRTPGYWEKVAEDKSLILNLGESILHLSYKYLPVHLKPCFLYLGLYPEDSLIDVSQLIKLWVAEGFIKSSRGQSLEAVAQSYFNDLVDRNLLLRTSSSTRRWKRWSTHDLVRDLCLKIGEKEKFFCAQRSLDENFHFISDQTTARLYLHASKMPSVFHPLILPAKERAQPFKTRLVRVFCFDNPNPHYDTLQEVNMRFLDHSYTGGHSYFLSSLVSRLWGLHTLIVSSTTKKVVASAEIWKMPQLRHIEIAHLSLPDPPPPSDDDVCVLENLQTLKTVYNLILTEEVCKRIPNIKELHVYYNFSWQGEPCPSYHLENLGCFNKLESLYYSSYRLQYGGDSLHNMIRFPSSLSELILTECKLEWSYMAEIASLPHLEYLKLGENAVAGAEWVFVDEKFVRLKHLSISGCPYVTKWIAQSFNFPVLEELTVLSLLQLEEIPSGIGEIPTLQLIDLCRCRKSANISAVEILYEQERFGNLGLRVEITTCKAELLRYEVQQLGLTCQNLVIRGS